MCVAISPLPNIFRGGAIKVLSKPLSGRQKAPSLPKMDDVGGVFCPGDRWKMRFLVTILGVLFHGSPCSCSHCRGVVVVPR